MGQEMYMIAIDTKKIKEHLAPFIDEKIELSLEKYLQENNSEVSKEELLNKIKTNPNKFTSLEVECLYYWMDNYLHSELYGDYQKRINKIRKTGSIRADVLKMNTLKFLKHYGVNLFLELRGWKYARVFQNIINAYNFHVEKEIKFYSDTDVYWIGTCFVKDLHHFSNFFLTYYSQACICFCDDYYNKKNKIKAAEVLNDVKIIDLEFYSFAIESFEEDKDAMDEDDINWLIESMFYYALSFEEEIVKMPIHSKVWNIYSY